MQDLFKTASAPVTSTLCGILAAFAAQPCLHAIHSNLARFFAGVSIFAVIYGLALMFVFGHWRGYIDLARASGIWPARKQPDVSKEQVKANDNEG